MNDQIQTMLLNKVREYNHKAITYKYVADELAEILRMVDREVKKDGVE